MADDKDYYMELLERMEPNLTGADYGPSLASIAISLKRIADAMERAHPPAPVDDRPDDEKDYDMERYSMR